MKVINLIIGIMFATFILVEGNPMPQNITNSPPNTNTIINVGKSGSYECPCPNCCDPTIEDLEEPREQIVIEKPPRDPGFFKQLFNFFKNIWRMIFGE